MNYRNYIQTTYQTIIMWCNSRNIDFLKIKREYDNKYESDPIALQIFDDIFYNALNGKYNIQMKDSYFDSLSFTLEKSIWAGLFISKSLEINRIEIEKTYFYEYLKKEVDIKTIDNDTLFLYKLNDNIIEKIKFYIKDLSNGIVNVNFDCLKINFNNEEYLHALSDICFITGYAIGYSLIYGKMLIA